MKRGLCFTKTHLFICNSSADVISAASLSLLISSLRTWCKLHTHTTANSTFSLTCPICLDFPLIIFKFPIFQVFPTIMSWKLTAAVNTNTLHDSRTESASVLKQRTRKVYCRDSQTGNTMWHEYSRNGRLWASSDSLRPVSVKLMRVVIYNMLLKVMLQLSDAASDDLRLRSTARVTELSQ